MVITFLLRFVPGAEVSDSVVFIFSVSEQRYAKRVLSVAVPAIALNLIVIFSQETRLKVYI